MAKMHVDFMGKRNWFFIFSGVLTVAAIAVLALIGLVRGIEFEGGTVMTFAGKQGVTAETVRTALEAAEVPNAQNATIQPTDDGGFIVRTAEKDVTTAERQFSVMAEELELPAGEVNITTIGAGWGDNVTRAALSALFVALIAILIYVWIRFEYKMSVTAVIALFHDALLVLGVYAISAREVTPNTIAALLTILGYSLYDTIVVFHRIRENTMNVTKRPFMELANESLNDVFVRWVNTAITQIIPVAALLLFGGETLRDFAFAMVVGLLSGAYSSMFLASPMYAVWKETEPKYKALAAKARRA